MVCNVLGKQHNIIKLTCDDYGVTVLVVGCRWRLLYDAYQAGHSSSRLCVVMWTAAVGRRAPLLEVSARNKVSLCQHG